MLNRIIALVILIAVALSAPTAFAGGTERSAPYDRFGTALTDTTLGTGTQIDTIDMLSSSLGFAVASPSNKGRGWFYLVQTTNLGDSWKVHGILPAPSYVGSYGFGVSPEIDFVNEMIGYTSSQDGSIYVTHNGGTSWSKMSIPGIWPTFVIAGDTISVVSDVCRGAAPAFGPLECPSELSQFHIGTTKPIRTTPIPALGQAGKWRGATAMASSTPESVVIAEGGREGTDSSLLSTSNAGETWNLLGDPCEGLNVNELLTSNPHRWLLYCFLDGGMNQGSSELWASTNGGESWSSVARANEVQGDDVGHIGDVDNTIYANGRGSILYGALGGAAGGLEYSTDGGARWILSPIRANLYGGSPEYVSTFGSTGAVFGILSGPQYRTLNGISWTELPALPAGKYEGHSICMAKRGTSVGLRASVTGIPATTIDFPVVFTNRGSSACYLNGIPTVQPVTGPKGRAVGPPAYPEGVNRRGGFVILKPDGGTASIVFEREETSSYPRSYCDPKSMRGITVHFAPPSSFYVKIPRGRVCTGASTVNAGGVVSGLISWL